MKSKTGNILKGNAASFIALCRNNPFCFGMGFYNAWLLLSFYSSSLFPSKVGTFSIDNLWGCGAWGCVVGLVLCFVPFHDVHKRIFSNRIVALVSFSTGFLTFLAALVAWAFPDSLQAGYIAGMAMFVSGISSGILSVLWYSSYKPLSSFETFAAVQGSIFLSVVVVSVASVVPFQFVAAGATVLLPLLSGACLLKCLSSFSGDSSLKADSGPLAKKPSMLFSLPFITLFMFAFGGELLRSVSLYVEGSDIDAMGVGYILMLGLGAAGWLVVSFFFDYGKMGGFAIMRMLRLSMVIMAFAFVVLAIAPISVSGSYAVFGLGFQCVRSFAAVVAIDVARRTGISIVRSVGSIQLACAAAPCLMTCILAGFPLTALNLPWGSVCMLFAFVLLVLSLFALGDASFENAWGIASYGKQENPFLDGCEKIIDPIELATNRLADDVCLSKREREVAYYLARGRSLPYIEEKLCISHGTSQTHQRHIYEKTGVHSRQEFLDLLDAYLGE